MIDERLDALSAPDVAASAFKAMSGGQSVSVFSWERRPFEIPIISARSVNEGEPSASRYWLSVVMPHGLDYLNLSAQAESLVWRNDFGRGGPYYRRMADPRHDWFLKEWLLACQKKQKDVVKDLDWNKAKVSLMVNGKQAYTREEVNELAAYLNIRPHELLMHPDDANAIRRLKAEMIRLAHESDDAETDPAAKKVSVN